MDSDGGERSNSDGDQRPMSGKRGLDRELVLDAAAEIADAEGIEAVTLARVASALNVKPPSLYSHVDGLPGLIGALRVRTLNGLTEALRDASVGRSEADALWSMAQAYRGYAKAHPGGYATILRAPDAGDTELQAAADRTIRSFAAVLRGWGLEGEQLIHTVRGLRSALHGFVTIELNGGFGMPVDLEVSFAELVETLIAGLRQRAQANAPQPVVTSTAG